MRTLVGFLISVLFLSSVNTWAAMSKKQLYAASMENDAQFIECVGNIFFSVGQFQRVILEDLKWESSNSEFQKIEKAQGFLKKADQNLLLALQNSDKLLNELKGADRGKFEKQLSGFKGQVQDLKARLEFIVVKIDQKKLPDTAEIHKVVLLAIAGTGFGMEVSKQKSKNDTKE